MFLGCFEGFPPFSLFVSMVFLHCLFKVLLQSSAFSFVVSIGFLFFHTENYLQKLANHCKSSFSQCFLAFSLFSNDFLQSDSLLLFNGFPAFSLVFSANKHLPSGNNPFAARYMPRQSNPL